MLWSSKQKSEIPIYYGNFGILLNKGRKKDTELFPKEIFNSSLPGIESLPHSIVIVLDGSIEDLISEEDGTFYKELVDISIIKGKYNHLKKGILLSMLFLLELIY